MKGRRARASDGRAALAVLGPLLAASLALLGFAVLAPQSFDAAWVEPEPGPAATLAPSSTAQPVDAAPGPRATVSGSGHTAPDRDAAVPGGAVVRRDETEDPAGAAALAVKITTPASREVVGGTSVHVTAVVEGLRATTVTSTPPGVSASVRAGGGEAAGDVALEREGANLVVVHAAETTSSGERLAGTAVEVIRDTLAPSVEVTSPAAGAVVGAGRIVLTVEVADATATTVEVRDVTARIAEGGGTAEVAVSLHAGANDLQIVVTDAAGNATRRTHRVTFDAGAPVVSIDSPVDGRRVGAGAPPLAVTAHVDCLTTTSVTSRPAGVSAELPAGGGVVLGAVPLQEGANCMTVTATSPTGARGTSSVTVVLDTTAPTVAFTAPHAGDALRGVADVHVVAADPLPGSGVATVTLLLDGSPLQTHASARFGTALDTTTLADGPHVLSATATDGLGNTSPPVALEIVVDNTAPVVTFDAPEPGAVVSGTTAFEVRVADDTSGVVDATLLVCGTSPTVDASRTWVRPVESDALRASDQTARRASGPATFTAEVRDAAGNVTHASVDVEIANTTPAPGLVAPRDGDVVRGTITLHREEPDENDAPTTFLVDGVPVADQASRASSVPFDTTLRLDGPMVVQLRQDGVPGGADAADGTAARVTVDNIAVALEPSVLHLATDDGGAPVRAVLSGPNLALLVPAASHAIQLRVPGGNSVSAARGDGSAPDIPPLARLLLEFPREELVASIRAGIAAGRIDAASRRVAITLVADGLEQGTAVIGFSEGE